MNFIRKEADFPMKNRRDLFHERRNDGRRKKANMDTIRVVILLPSLFLWVTHAGCCSLVGRKQFFSPVKVTSKDYFPFFSSRERDLIAWIKSHLAENIKKLKRLFLEEN